IRLLQDIRTAMPDLEVVVEDCIGEERKVFTWSTLIGTIVRPTLGSPASDKVLEQGPHGVGGAVAQQGFPLQKLVHR
ncbi:ester cyclase, partial [Listeria monocytogenes]|nr:ester cyclase [Listeria monocytogenes]